MRYYIFDLDNTLYSSKNGLFKEVDNKINRYLIKFLGIPEDKVNEIRKKYWIKYGTTLNGLMKHYKIDPIHYLEFVHDVELDKFLQKDSELKKILTKLDGKKVIFTNGFVPFAERVLNCLGILDVFDDIFDIVWMDFCPKPNIDGYRKIIKTLDCTPKFCVFFDDFYLNLFPAKKVNMKTVLVKDMVDEFDFVDYKIENIKSLKKLKNNIDF